MKLIHVQDKKAGQGFSLIEVLIACFVLSFCLLGFQEGRLIALHATHHAYFISLADLKNNELAERLNSCSYQSFCIEEQLKVWKEEVKSVFPEIKESSLDGDSNYRSHITWVSMYKPSPLTHSAYLF